jgi:UDP-GlcNAc:undecaprenyl-phosphate GlcNAc-1-phosphate transferase
MYLAPILAAFATLVICLFARPLAVRLKVMDVPDAVRKHHAAPTPLIGGLAIVLPMIGVAVFFAVDSGSGIFVRLIISIGVSFLIGYADDRFDVSPAIRLFMAFALCLGVFSGDSNLIIGILHSSYDGFSLSLSSWAWPFTLIATVGFIYAFNMTDGIDGLAIGQGLIWTILLLLVGNGELNWFLITLAAVLAVTLLFNLKKKLFLGDSGAYALSIIFGITIIYFYNHTVGMKADMVVVWLLFPVLDCLRLILTRLARRVSPLSADNNHLHHYLLLLLPKALVVPAILAVIAVAGLLTIFLPELTLVWLGASLAVYFSVVLAAEHKRRTMCP